jgi:hypothetical protein
MHGDTRFNVRMCANWHTLLRSYLFYSATCIHRHAHAISSFVLWYISHYYAVTDMFFALLWRVTLYRLLLD